MATDKNRVVEGLTFQQWLKKANAECMAVCGLTLDDLPDSCTWDAWDSGTTPADHAREVLREEGYPFE